MLTLVLDCYLFSLKFQLLSSFCVFVQSKEEVMAARLREADNIAAMAELQQQISELEIQVKSQHTATLLCNLSLLLPRQALKLFNFLTNHI